MFKTFEYIYFLYESDLFIVTFFSFSLHCFDLVILVLPYHILKYWCKNYILEETISPNNYIENFFSLFKLVWPQKTLHSDVVEMYGVIFAASII